MFVNPKLFIAIPVPNNHDTGRKTKAHYQKYAGNCD